MAARGHAVVIGAGMAGLFAARVLADRFPKVTVLDRDTFPEAGARGGVPQGRHAHGLLDSGRRIMGELFPGLLEDLARSGVPHGDLLEAGRFYFGARPLARTRSGLTGFGASRPHLEAAVRERVRARPEVTFLERCEVTGLRHDAGRVTGVTVVRRGGDRTPVALDGDLVVDASGRTSRTPDRLVALGYPAPAVEEVRIDLQYTSRRYRFDRRSLGGDIVIVFAATPEFPRGCVVAEIEGGIGLVSLIGVLGDHPPTDPEGFTAFADPIPVPELHRILHEAEPLGPATGFRHPSSIRRRYERLERSPDGLLVIGDALCCFNPAYGQGMSVAALQAAALRRELDRAGADGGTPDAGRFYRSAAQAVAAPWQIAVGGDLAFDAVPGRRSLGTRVLNRYVTRFQAAAADDRALAVAFARVASLVDAPPRLMRPDRLLRVAVHGTRGDARRAAG